MCEKKADLKKRNVASPNLADAVVIALYHNDKGGGFFD
jgi:hypothetical protein